MAPFSCNDTNIIIASYLNGWDNASVAEVIPVYGKALEGRLHQQEKARRLQVRMLELQRRKSQRVTDAMALMGWTQEYAENVMEYDYHF